MLLRVKRIVEIVSDDITKIRCITTTDEYAEIRLKENWLDVRIGKMDYESLRCIYREKVCEDLCVNEIIKKLGIIFE